MTARDTETLKIIELEGLLRRVTTVLKASPPMRSIDDHRYQAWCLRRDELLRELEES